MSDPTGRAPRGTARTSTATPASRPAASDDRRWAEVAARVEEWSRSLESGASDPEADRRLLEERARKLAVRPSVQPVEEPVELLRFEVGGRDHAIESRYVVAVVRDVRPTALPGAAPPVVAVVAWRGRVMTVLDLRQALAAPRQPAGGHQHLVVLGDSGPELGVLVDGVDSLVTHLPSELHPVPEGTPARAEYLRAITPDTVIVLDAAAILRIHAADD